MRCAVVPRVIVPLSNLRAVVIVVVVAFHSALPYLASQPSTPFPFDVAPYRWVAFPIIDRERFFGFDLFCAFQDVSLMSLMFLLAGLFTAASLRRKGSLGYLIDRCWRIGLPFCLGAAILAPLAYYASYRATAADPSFEAFARHWLDLPMWPAGPAWFLWQLLLLSALAALLHRVRPRALALLGQIAGRAGDRPMAAFAVFAALSAIAYVPLAMAFSAWDWISLGPFSVQLSRPLHYLLYFLAGIALGSHGLDRALMKCDGPLARHWLALLSAAFAAFALWGAFTSMTLPDWNASPLVARLAAALAFPLACASGVLGWLAVALRFFHFEDRAFDSLSANAYGIYLLHYVVVVWLQYALLALAFPALAKGIVVLALSLVASWAASGFLRALLARLRHAESRAAMLR
jgi:surface polysaccharide O-acyltransferase-like enzyme